MVCTIHHKFNASSDLTKLTNNKFIAIPFIKMCDVAFKIRISYICKIADNNILILNRWLYIYFLVISSYWMDNIRIRILLVFHFLNKFFNISQIPSSLIILGADFPASTNIFLPLR